MFLATMDGTKTYDWSNSAVAAVISIILVFAVLLIIIGITVLVFKEMGLIQLGLKNRKKKGKKTKTGFDEKDEDMVAAVLVATIDYQKETKKDVKLISVKEIK